MAPSKSTIPSPVIMVNYQYHVPVYHVPESATNEDQITSSVKYTSKHMAKEPLSHDSDFLL